MLRHSLARRSHAFRRPFSSTSLRSKEVTLTVDGREVTVDARSALIQAIEKAGVQVPRYCYHEKLAVAGNCRMCLVDVEKARKPVASCSFPVSNGMVVHTRNEKAKLYQEGVTEMILGNHPLDCPVCDQGGECDLQDQTLRYGSDRGRFHEIAGKRATEDKNIGPLVKTSMNRCIQCTRCVRFTNEIAGAPELGTTGRGNDMQIGTYLERNLRSELSGNIIDLCPVGALTSKPYAFKARPWELKKTETIDVHDGMGSNIRVDSRGQSVLRVLPRINDEVNEEWISDKTRFAVDGLNLQRLTQPLVRVNDQFAPATWEDALLLIQQKIDDAKLGSNEFKAVAGDLVDVESAVALKDLANRLNSENLTHDYVNGDKPLPTGVDLRPNYLFNAGFQGVEEADAVLLVGTNPRTEAAVLNARMRMHWLHNDVEIGLVGENFDSTFEYSHFNKLSEAVDGRSNFGKKLANAKRPLIIIGSQAAETNSDILQQVSDYAKKNPNLVTDEWQGINVLQRAASRAGLYDIGFAVPSEEVSATKPKVVYLLGADEHTEVPKDAFVIYQGHHGDVGAPLADVILPGAAYTEKSSTYINSEGRAQQTRAAVGPPGGAREDWKVLKAVSDVLGVPLPYETDVELQDRLAEIAPNLLSHDVLEPSDLAKLAASELGRHAKSLAAEGLSTPITNFYFTNAIARSSPTMAKASAAFDKPESEEGVSHFVQL